MTKILQNKYFHSVPSLPYNSQNPKLCFAPWLIKLAQSAFATGELTKF